MSGMTWQEVLKKVLSHKVSLGQTAAKILQIEELRSMDIRTLDFSQFNYDFSVATDVLANYYPVTSEIRAPPSGSKILYDVEKIALYADKNLYNVCEGLGLGVPCEELIKAFRYAFSHAIRRHAIFHYLVERACRLMVENRYEEYRVKIYERRKEMGHPNLEEALADAYSIVYVDLDLKNLQNFLPLPLKNNDLIIAFRKIIRAIFTANNRPMEYSHAKRFITEFESLRETENNPEEIKRLIAYSISLRGGRALDGVFKGLSWLFHEITAVEPVNFIEKTLPPKSPYPIKDFLVFLENFRSDDALFLTIFPPPTEEIKV